MAGLLSRVWAAIWNAEQSATVPGALVPAGPARYTISAPGTELRQGEIISNLSYYVVRGDDAGQTDVTAITIPYAIVVTPDCDLLQAFNARRVGQPTKINGVLFFEAEESGSAKTRLNKNRHEWKVIGKNQFEGLHHLDLFRIEDDHLGQQIPNLIVDFKRYFMLPMDEVYRQFDLPGEARAARRCCLGDQFREDFSRRVWSFMGRVPTPDSDELP